MEKSKLYTMTGDGGMTSLVYGERVPKTCLRLDAYGTLDEFSSFLGVALSREDCPADMKAELLDIQNRLFDVGCYLATAAKPGSEAPADIPGLCAEDIREVEGWIDSRDAAVPKVNAFVLPGGCGLAAALHVARAVCRRAERRVLALAAEEPVCPAVTRYLNRLSDYLFILSRQANHLSGTPELTWTAASKKG